MLPVDVQPTVISKSPIYPKRAVGLHPRDVGQLLAGKRLGHFELSEYVGGGGMGAVFRAVDLMLNRTVAVKVLSQDQSTDEETVRRFKNEAQSAARLDHENIGRVYYVGEDDGWHYIVFEFIEGLNLRETVERQGPLPLETIVSYTLQVADALAHASHRDVVHRDIKPSNVIITPDQRAKLVDMGLARLHQVEPAGNDLTASGVTLGTFDYISPEQARDPRAADVRSDIYSLGCTVYFMLTGRPPFPGGTVLQKLLQHQGDEPPDPRQDRSDLPDEFVRVLNKMLAKSPSKRYQRPDELIADLVAFANLYGLPTTPVSTVTWKDIGDSPATRLVRHLPWLVPASLLVLVVSVLAILGSLSREGANPPRIRPSSPSGSLSTSSFERDGASSSGASALPAGSGSENGLDRHDTRSVIPSADLPSAPKSLLPIDENKPAPGIEPSMTEEYFKYENLFPTLKQQSPVPSALPDAVRGETYPAESGPGQR